MRKRSCISLLFLLALFASPLHLLSQATASATIVGTVTDPSGAVVGATVTATNKATGASRTTVATTAGDFRFDAVAPGAYTVKVTQSGYATYEQTLEVLVGQTATVPAVLKVGQTSELVEVKAGEVVIDLQ